MKVRALAPLVLVGLVATACQPGPTPTQRTADIIIASDLPATAESDALSTQQAIQLAMDRHPTIGRYRLAYMPLDDTLAGTGQPEKGVQNVKQMIANGRVLAMIGPYTSSLAFAELPIANAAGLVMLSPSNTNACLTLASPVCTPEPAALRPSGPNDYFRTAPPDPVQGRAMARFAFGQLHVRKVAAFGEIPAVDDAFIDNFAAELARLGGELVLRQELARNTTAFTGFLTMASDRGAQAIFAPTLGDHACAARAQMKRIFPADAYFLASDAIFTDSNCIPDAADNAEGMLATVPAVDPTRSADPAVKKVLEAYRQKFPSPEISPYTHSYTYTFAAYDCALLLIDAIRHAIDKNGGSLPTRPQVVDAVAHTQFKGVMGTYSFDGNGDVISPPMTLYQVRNGSWAYVQEIDASSIPS